MTKRQIGLSAACAALALTGSSTMDSAQAADGAKVSAPGRYSGYAPVKYDGAERTSFHVPMRDGTKLAVDLFRPTAKGKVAAEKLPVVWMHTPYNRRTYQGGPTVERYPGFAMELVKYGYNVAVVDFRGLYASNGGNKAYNRGEWLEPASTDAYDMTEWFARQPFSNGKIGMWGCSATGGSQMQAATTLPPSLKAIMPMSAEFDAYLFTTHGGVAGLGPMGPGGGPPQANANAERDKAATPVDGPDGAALLAAAIAQHRDNVESPGTLPFRDSHSEALGADWWVKSSPSTHLDKLKTSTFGVYAAANWNEAGTKPGAFYTFNNLPRANTKLVVGPGTHCAWSDVKDKTGFAITTEELRFFDYWLKGVQNGVMSEDRVTYYTYNAPAETAWRTAKAWPLPNEKRTNFYLADGKLAATRPASAGVQSTPMTPAPQATSILIAEQSGGLNYDTEPLKADLEVTGHPVIHLWISSQAADADVQTQIDDVAPDGTTTSYQMVGRLRASHRTLATAPFNTFGLPWRTFKAADARPLEAGKPAELVFDLLPMSYLFKAGHRIRLHVTFADPARKAGTPPVVQVHTGPGQLSFLTLPVIPAK